MTDITQEAMRAAMERDLSEYREGLEMCPGFVLDEDQENAYRDGWNDGSIRATAQSAEKIAKLETDCALYAAEEKRIWELMPELRNTDAHYELHEGVHEKIARLEAEKAEFADELMHSQENEQHWVQRTAAAELSNKQLRDLRYELAGIAADVDAGKGFDIVCRKTLRRVMEALAQPISTEALDTYVANAIDEYLRGPKVHQDISCDPEIMPLPPAPEKE